MEHLQIDLVLIDDDELVRATWKMCARLKGHRLVCFETEKQFLQSNIELNVPVYIDYNLKSNHNGFEIAKNLHGKGYRQIFIASGSNFKDQPAEIQKIVGKEYPL